MKIYTSYFAHIPKLPYNVVPISITLSSPKGYKGLCYRKLAPTWDILCQYKRNSNEAEYTQRYYREILGNLDINQVIKDISDMSNGNDVALICFEKKESFCHRHIVAQWMIDNVIECKEID